MVVVPVVCCVAACEAKRDWSHRISSQSSVPPDSPSEEKNDKPLVRWSSRSDATPCRRFLLLFSFTSFFFFFIFARVMAPVPAQPPNGVSAVVKAILFLTLCRPLGMADLINLGQR